MLELYVQVAVLKIFLAVICTVKKEMFCGVYVEMNFFFLFRSVMASVAVCTSISVRGKISLNPGRLCLTPRKL